MTTVKEINEYIKTIYPLCSSETCYPKVARMWTDDNRFYGHCAVISLLLQDRFGGKIKKGKIVREGISHYWNEIDGFDYDATICQYRETPTVEVVEVADRKKLLSVKDTKNRYDKLKKLLGE